ncbi:hypothetical protein R3W88_022642 [Solanum pinnatisectum]|uniref:Uncharacterized protein n=1 Tax=Solanum pinnatisectum TaxID=50273 RepID=A0AAV9LV61_9SOLN|nr:hypothetical protein R3W88_022642 [Solanum pinnatisectum]
MINMLILTSRIDQDIIYEHNYKHIKVLSKHPIHQVHKCHRGISQTKGHHQKLTMTISRSKSRFQNIFLFQSQLVIT